MTISIKHVTDRLNIPISTIHYYDKMRLFPFIILAKKTPSSRSVKVTAQ